MFAPVDYVRAYCDFHKIPVSRLETDCGFSNGYLNPKKLKKIPYDRAVSIADYLGVPLDYLLEKKEVAEYSSELSKKICADIMSALENNQSGVVFVIPPEIMKEIVSGNYIFSNVTYPQFSILTGKTIEDYIPPVREKQPDTHRVELTPLQAEAWELIRSMDDNSLQLFIRMAKGALGL